MSSMNALNPVTHSLKLTRDGKSAECPVCKGTNENVGIEGHFEDDCPFCHFGIIELCAACGRLHDPYGFLAKAHIECCAYPCDGESATGDL